MERKKQRKERRRDGETERQRNKVRNHHEQPSHLASASTLHCHCERELVHSSDSLKHCQSGRQSEKWGGGRREGGGGGRE